MRAGVGARTMAVFEVIRQSVKVAGPSTNTPPPSTIPTVLPSISHLLKVVVALPTLTPPPCERKGRFYWESCTRVWNVREVFAHVVMRALGDA